MVRNLLSFFVGIALILASKIFHHTSGLCLANCCKWWKGLGVSESPSVTKGYPNVWPALKVFLINGDYQQIGGRQSLVRMIIACHYDGANDTYFAVCACVSYPVHSVVPYNHKYCLPVIIYLHEIYESFRGAHIFYFQIHCLMVTRLLIHPCHLPNAVWLFMVMLWCFFLEQLQTIYNGNG